ncbi:MAG: GxxExxY protein [Pseudomonadota bacterium]
MNRRGAEAQRINELTDRIIGCAIDVHKAIGPGLLESAYEQCLSREMELGGIRFKRQVTLPVEYKGSKLDCGYVMDIVVEDLVIVELKTVERILPVHEAQLLTYLKLYKRSVGLLLNFNVDVMRQGIKRIVNNFIEPSAPPRLCG